MQYTDTGAALIGGLISTYFFQPAVFASLKDACSRVLGCICTRMRSLPPTFCRFGRL